MKNDLEDRPKITISVPLLASEEAGQSSNMSEGEGPSNQRPFPILPNQNLEEGEKFSNVSLGEEASNQGPHPILDPPILLECGQPSNVSRGEGLSNEDLVLGLGTEFVSLNLGTGEGKPSEQKSDPVVDFHGGGQPSIVSGEEGPPNEDHVSAPTFKRRRGRPPLTERSIQVRPPYQKPLSVPLSAPVVGRKRGRPRKKSNVNSQEGHPKEGDSENRAEKKRKRLSKKTEVQPPSHGMNPIDEEGCSEQQLSPGPEPFLGQDRSIILPEFDSTGHSDDEDVDKEKIKGSDRGVGRHQCPPGEARFMAGPLDDLGPAVKCQYTSKRLQSITEFCEQHSIDGLVNLVVLNVPSGTAVYGVESTVTPPWNVLHPSFITYGMLLASQFLSKKGWLVCIHTTAQDTEVEDAARAQDFCRWRSFTLLSSHPIYCQTEHPNFIYSLIVSVFHRECEDAKANYLSAGKLGHGECSLSRDTMVEKVDPNEWARKEDGRPWRGGAERAASIWRFIVLTFSRCGDSVIDLAAGTGTLVKMASQLGRHALGIECDHLILEHLLKPSEFVILKD